MQLHKLSNESLNQKIISLSSQERALLREVLEHIAEADRRRLYLTLGYSSLFSYLTEACSYSAGAAQRRIDAARLLNELPEVADKIESGDLNLAQIVILQKGAREKKNVTRDTKLKLVKSLQNKNTAESQKLVALELDLEIKEAPRVTHQKDDSVRIEVSFTKEEWDLINQARNLMSHEVPTGKWSDLLVHLAKERVKKSKRPIDKPQSKTVTEKKRDYILQRDGSCQFKAANGKVCGSLWMLEADHINPVWNGGDNSVENLRALCGAHNRQRYNNQVGRQRAATVAVGKTEQGRS